MPNCMNQKKEEEEIITKEKMQQKDIRVMKIMEGYDFGWKFPSKNINKMSTYGGATPTCVKIITHIPYSRMRTI